MNNLDVPEGKFCYDLIQKAGKFDITWYDWSEEQLRDYLDKNSGNGYVFIEYHYTDLGRDEKWLKEQIRAMKEVHKNMPNHNMNHMNHK